MIVYLVVFDIDAGNKNINIDKCLGRGKTNAKPMLMRLSSLNLGDTNNQLADSEAKGLSVFSHNLTTSLQDTRILKNLDNVERFFSKPSSSNNQTKNKSNDANTKMGAYDKDISKNISVLGSDKWGTTKEKFLENDIKTNLEKETIDVSKNLFHSDDKSKSYSKDLQVPKVSVGAVLIKESFIELPRISRVSKSFHGKTSSNSNLDISSTPRRASDSVSSLTKKQDEPPETLKNIFPTSKAPKSPRRSSEAAYNKSINTDRPLVSQLSHPGPSNIAHGSNRKASLNLETKTRFTTTLVDEAEHAASVNQQSEVRLPSNDPTVTLASTHSSITHGFHVDKNK